jgi:hypothetical protein
VERNMSDRVGDYSDLVASLARRHCAGSRSAGHPITGMDIAGEYDDLYQEGLLAVWQCLERGVTPSAEVLGQRMTDWKRLMKYQSGRGGHKGLSYTTILPLEDFH